MVVKSTNKGDMLFETVIGNHTILTDVPAGIGGKDRAPLPPQLFAASISSCVAAIVTEFCNRKGFDAKDLSVEVSFDKDEVTSALKNIKVNVFLPHVACEEDKKKMLQRVAEHCPVHETIINTGAIEFHINEKEQAA